MDDEAIQGYRTRRNCFVVFILDREKVRVYNAREGVGSYIYLHFHCESLNEPLHLRCGSYLHEQIDLSHTYVCVTLNTYRHDDKRGKIGVWAVPNPTLCLILFKISGKPAELGEH